MKTIRMVLSIFCFLGIYVGDLSASDDRSVNDFVNELTPKPASEHRTLKPKFGENRDIGGKRAEPSVTIHLQFRRNSDQLMSEDIDILKKLGKAIQHEKLKGYIYKIEGHTCDLGSNNDNLDLSRRRALSVQKFLHDNFDLPTDQFEIAAYGETRPIVPSTDESAREKNRRVVVRNTLKPLVHNSKDQISTDVKVKYLRDGREAILDNGGILSQDDNYSVEFKSKTSVYVYVWQSDEAGNKKQIFPNPDFSKQSNPVEAGTLYRIPDDGQWLYLGGTSGKEHIIVFAHRQALSEPDKICQNILQNNDNPMMASSAQRSLKGKRKELPYQQNPLPQSDSQTMPKNLFVFKRYFFHR